MKNALLNKTWLSPFVAAAFAVIAVTGVLLFFHFKNGPIMVLHEWFGWGFVVAGTVHALLNLRPLLAYLRQTAALVSLGVALILVVGLTLAGAGHEQGPGHHGHGVQPVSNSSAIP